MTQAQKGVCAEPNLHALYLLFNVIDDDATLMRQRLVQLLDLFDETEVEHYEAMLTGMIGIGNQYWQDIYPEQVPQLLQPFPVLRHDDRYAPETPYDLFVQIRSDRLDICHSVGRAVMSLLVSHAELIEQVQGFRYLEGRDLNGFLYGQDNPRGTRRREVALVGEEDRVFQGGSYVHIQRFRHDLVRWFSMTERQREQVMGVTQAHHQPSEECNSSSHVIRAVALDPVSGDAALLKQGMPYGDMLQQGLFFVSCAASPRAFREMLTSQIIGNAEGDYDRWLDFTSAESGAAFFAPSATFIRENG